MTRTIWNTLATLAVLIFTVLPLSAAEVVTYYHNDHLGSPIAATDSTGAVVWQQAYDPWGFKLTANTDERGYTGNWLDEETGLADHKARWYTSSIGRFTGIDPVKWHETNIHSFNRYSYSGNNPYTNTDVGGELFFSFHMNRRDMSTKHAMIAGQVGNIGAQTAMGLHAAGGAAKLVVGGARSLLKMGLQNVNATHNVASGVLKRFGHSIDDLSSAASQPFKNTGLTKAARALDKHAAGQRGSGTFPALSGNSAARNRQSQQIVDDILNNSKSEFKILGRGGLEVRSPSGQGVRFNKDGAFSGFVD